jgi:hypothetical protein
MVLTHKKGVVPDLYIVEITVMSMNYLNAVY